MNNVYTLLTLFMISTFMKIMTATTVELFSSIGDGHDKNNPYSASIETVVGEVDTSRCQDIEIQFQFNMGHSTCGALSNGCHAQIHGFKAGWQYPLYIGTRDKVYAQFGVKYRATSNVYNVDTRFEYSDQNGNLIVTGQIVGVNGNSWWPLGSWVNIRLQIRSNGYFDMIYGDGSRKPLNNKPLIYLPDAGDLQSIIVGKDDIETGNSRIADIIIKCLSCQLPPPPPKCVIPVECLTDVPLDIGFLIDESGSIGQNENGQDAYKTMIEFIIRLIKYDINSESYVSLFRYSSDFNQLIDFTKNVKDNGRDTLTDLLTQRLNVAPAGGTNTGSAIIQTLNNFDMNNERNDLLFILTDGDSDDIVCGVNGITNTDIGNTEIVLIGVGEGLDIEDLKSSQYSCLYDNVNNDVYYIPDFNSESFESIENDLREKTCKTEICSDDDTSVISAAYTPYQFISIPDNQNKLSWNDENNILYIVIVIAVLMGIIIIVLLCKVTRLRKSLNRYIDLVNKLHQNDENKHILNDN